MAVCAVSDVESRLRRELSDDEQRDARDLITQYQAELEGLLGRGLERLTRTESAPWPLRTDRYYVRRGPIASVTTTTIGGMAVNAMDYEVSRDAIAVNSWLATPGVLSVTYVGGWLPEDAAPAKAVVVARVARMMVRHDDDDEGVDTSSVEGHQVKWQEDAFTEQELEACSRLRHPDMAG